MHYFTISQLAQEFDISTRTIRYYEERGLIAPIRTESGQRLYTKKERAKLKLILRGKRFGFSLEEIHEMISLFDQDRTGRKQLEKTIEYGRQKIKEVSERIDDLMQLKEEMEAMQWILKSDCANWRDRMDEHFGAARPQCEKISG